jgi:hypothetical protein
MNPIFATLVRHGLTVAAGVLGTRYGVSVEPDLIEALSAVICGGAALGWSIYEKRGGANG